LVRLQCDAQTNPDTQTQDHSCLIAFEPTYSSARGVRWGGKGFQRYRTSWQVIWPKPGGLGVLILLQRVVGRSIHTWGSRPAGRPPRPGPAAAAASGRTCELLPTYRGHRHNEATLRRVIHDSASEERLLTILPSVKNDGAE